MLVDYSSQQHFEVLDFDITNIKTKLDVTLMDGGKQWLIMLISEKRVILNFRFTDRSSDEEVKKECEYIQEDCKTFAALHNDMMIKHSVLWVW